MFAPHLFFGFVLATSALMLIPGPNVALIVGNSLAHGTRAGLVTLSGTASAMVPQLALTAIGMSAALAGAGAVFGWLRWVGAAYLIWLGLREWRAAPAELAAVTAAPTSGKVWLRGFLVSCANPKTLLFYGAFFPQFVDPHRPLAPQMALLCTTFLALALFWDSLWAVLAARARPLLVGRARLRRRLTGSVLIGAGAALMLRRA